MGCAYGPVSLQSKQLEFVKVRLGSSSISAPRPNWVTRWRGDSRQTYAVDVADQTLFATESGLMLIFSEGRVVEARHFFPGKIVSIRKSTEGLEYLVDNQIIAAHECTNWQQAVSTSSVSEFFQRCEGNDGEYVNRYLLDTDQRLIDLTFVIHPFFPSVQVEHIGN